MTAQLRAFAKLCSCAVPQRALRTRTGATNTHMVSRRGALAAGLRCEKARAVDCIHQGTKPLVGAELGGESGYRLAIFLGIEGALQQSEPQKQHGSLGYIGETVVLDDFPLASVVEPLDLRAIHANFAGQAD